MKTASQIRRANLARLAEEYGGLGNINEKLGRTRSDSTLRQIRGRVKLTNGYFREMGDGVAREIEEKLGLEPGWMDHEHDELRTEGKDPAAKPAADYLDFPIVGVGEGEGGGLAVKEVKGLLIPNITVPSQWVKDNGLDTAYLRAVLVEGDWMAPLIPRRSVVLLDLRRTGSSDFRNEVCAIRYKGEFRICRLDRILDGSLLVRYENTHMYSTERVPPELEGSPSFSFIGRVKFALTMKPLA